MGKKAFSLDNAAYLDEMFARWRMHPEEFDAEWGHFFEGLSLGLGRSEAVCDQTMAGLQARVDSLIYAYRDIGYLSAQLDPLQQRLECAHELSLDEFGLSESDLDRTFSAGHFPGMEMATLAEIIEACRETYCRTIGADYLHIQDKSIRRWLQNRMESVRNHPSHSSDKKFLIMKKLIEAEEFEHFLHTQYTGQKRFSLEGAETLIAALHAVVEYSPQAGVRNIVMGMSHRGRLNVLANIMDKSISEIFSEFEDNFLPETFGGDGDVKYHLGYSTDHMNHAGQICHLSLTANPSHLEIVGPVVQGKVRAKQRRHGDTEERRAVLGLLLHGDAAFTGQGVVPETFNLSQLKGYRTGGTLHVIVNNQIGFTTSPRDMRSSCFPTDLAKMLQIPIFHVNADDPEAAVFVIELALDFRQTFHRDVVIDLFCFRRHGHNEGDEPSFTQPRLYELIKAHPGTRTIYARQLLAEGVIDEATLGSMEQEVSDYFTRAFKLVKEKPLPPTLRNHRGIWQDLGNRYSHDRVETAVSEKQLRRIADVLHAGPPDFAMHPKLRGILDRRIKRFRDEGMLDWALAESLAFGSLLSEGTPVRLSGQDSGRGTFSHRHSVWWDVKTSHPFIPLNHLDEAQARFCVYDSPLSEAAVLGFEYGYSLAEPRMLILWEAQFGDFANGAQMIIDQFLISSESKWRRSSGLVLLLPHGYEGQGPEHSTGHLERFLQLSAEDNIQVCNATTPAQYFHLLRRQVRRNFRKPLIVMVPKSLLRHPRVVSSIGDISVGTFEEVLDDPAAPRDASRLALCSGKLYYDLLERREQIGPPFTTALLRLEQLYPWPENQLRDVIARYPAIDEVVWIQEEPANRGGWTHVRNRLPDLFSGRQLRFIGRDASASPATGSLKQHKREQETIIRSLLGE